MVEQALDLRDHRGGMLEARQFLDDLPVALVGKSSMMMVVRAVREGLFESVRMQHEALSGGQLHLVLLEDLHGETSAVGSVKSSEGT